MHFRQQWKRCQARSGKPDHQLGGK